MKQPVGALLALGVLSLFVPQASSQPSPSGTIVRLSIDGEIEPILADYIQEGIARAADERASLVLIRMDTPGGLDESMRQIIQAILRSPVPVAVYVEPDGARAASAGFFILLSADIAAMSPGTEMGAASPLLELGGYPVQVDPTLRKKIIEDTLAFLRSYAGRRGRNIDFAQKAVTDAKAYTEKEALDDKLIDLTANSEQELFAQLNGRTITRFDGSRVTLELAQPRIIDHEMSARERFLSRIVQPDVFFVLLLVGVLGLYAEFTHPGLVAPGVIGGICLVLALFAMHLLPVNFAGLLLILLGIALFVLEAKYSGHGILGVGGVISLMLGAVMLVRSPLTAGGVGLGAALGATIPFAVFFFLLARLVFRSSLWRPATGREAMVGAVGEATEPVDSRQGMVFVNGELWRALRAGGNGGGVPIPKGARVRVVNVEGLTLRVEPAEPSAARLDRN
ncbi:MAG TPA: nodulation protein NfeD [Candidatus Acidoferrales bacterium]|nr:nodulation protein NfeD [Candidatus Acidoferrales bacterium]